jgi:hypothetical protein
LKVARCVLAALPLLSAPVAASAEPSVSTAPARASRPPRAPAAPSNPWALTYGLDRRGDRYGRVDYSLRWSLRDLAGARGEAPSPGLPFEDTVRGLMQGMRVDVYGVRLRPFRDLSLTPSPPLADLAASSAAASAATTPGRRRPVYSWERFYEDLENSARRETERFIVREGFDFALPRHRSVPYEQKKALGSGLLDLGRVER